MSPSRQCRQCGAEVRGDLVGGLCPKCLARMTLRETSIGPWREEIGSNATEDRAGTGAEEAALAEPGSGGRVFGDYELQQEIARGGMGVVYRARQRSLNRTVAVKMLLFPGFAGPEAVARFRLEAEAAARLQHPHIVAIHDVGEEAGQPYIAMEHVEGTNLEELAREQAIAPKRAAGYLCRIADAVHHAHQRGVLHRDLKPSNVLIDASDEPRITDFGLAKVLTSDSRLTMTGQVLGSPGYIPPEQADGKDREVGVQADVYALGAVLYYLLTRRPPFEGGSLTETLERVRHSEPIAPRQLAPGMPRDLETICLKCLRKAPERRYGSARELAEDLGRFQAGEPILARPITAPGRLWRWCRRRPALASVGAVALVLLLILAVGGPMSASRYRRLAEDQRQLLYASELKAAYQAIEMGNMGQAVNYLDQHRPTGDQPDLREFTWHYLKRLCRPYEEMPVLDHGVPVFFLAVTRDGQRLAACGALDEITIWDTRTRSRLLRFSSGEDVLTGQLSFSAGGRLLATAGHGMNTSRLGLQIYDLANLEHPHRVEGLSFPAGYDGAVSPDGSLFAVPVLNRILMLEFGEDPRVIEKVGEFPVNSRTARFSPDGEWLVTAGWGTNAIVWRVADGAQLGTFTGHTGKVHAAVFSADGREVISVGHNDVIRVWDATSLEERYSYEHDACPGALDLSPDGRWVASGGRDGMVKLWDVKRGEFRTLRGHSKSVQTVRFVPKTSLLATGSWDGTVRLWDLDAHESDDAVEGSSDERSPVAFSPDSRLLATVASAGQDILLWNARSGAIQSRLPYVAPDLATLTAAEGADGLDASYGDQSGMVEDLTISRQGVLAVARSLQIKLGGTEERRRLIELWDMANGILTNSLEGRAPVCYSQDGRWMAWQGADQGSIHWTDLQTGKRGSARQEVYPQEAERMGLALSPDGRTLAANGLGTVLWDTATGEILKTLSSSADKHGPLNTLRFTPKGRWLIGAGVRGDIHVWDVASGRVAAVLRNHSSGISSLAVSHDGRTLATGDVSGLLRLWALEPDFGQSAGGRAARELLTLDTDAKEVNDLAFSPDNGLLASSGPDGAVRLWRAR